MAQMIDLEDRVELSKQLAENYKPQLFFRKMCGTELHKTTELVLQENQKTRQIGPYVADNSDSGKVMARDGFSRKLFTPPTVHPSRVISGRDVEDSRSSEMFIEINSSGVTPEQITTNTMMNDQLDLQEMIERREEQQIIEGITTGNINVVGDGVNRTIALPIASSHIFNAASADKFDAAGSNPITYLKKLNSGLLVKDGGSRARVGVFGEEAFEAFIENAQVKAFLDNRRYEFGQVNPTTDQEFEGLIYQGKILGMDIYTYDEFYFDETTKKDVAMFPKDRVVLIGAGAGLTMHYGAIADGANGTINVCQTYSYTWIEGGKKKWLDLESKPLFVPKNGNGIVSVKVV